MKPQISRRLYYQIRPEERVQLVRAAIARGDTIQAAQLRYSCPPEEVGEFTELLDRMERVARGFFFPWHDVSHRVVRSYLCAAHFVDAVPIGELFMRIAPPGSKKEIKIGLGEDRAMLVACAMQWRKWSAAWKGIEAGITRFCAERGLTVQELLPEALLMSTIDEARAVLDDDVPADPQTENLVYQMACHMVPGPNARGKG
jgi:hypothetical protein